MFVVSTRARHSRLCGEFPLAFLFSSIWRVRCSATTADGWMPRARAQHGPEDYGRLYRFPHLDATDEARRRLRVARGASNVANQQRSCSSRKYCGRATSRAAERLSTSCMCRIGNSSATRPRSLRTYRIAQGQAARGEAGQADP